MLFLTQGIQLVSQLSLPFFNSIRLTHLRVGVEAFAFALPFFRVTIAAGISISGDHLPRIVHFHILHRPLLLLLLLSLLLLVLPISLPLWLLHTLSLFLPLMRLLLLHRHIMSLLLLPLGLMLLLLTPAHLLRLSHGRGGRGAVVRAGVGGVGPGGSGEAGDGEGPAVEEAAELGRGERGRGHRPAARGVVPAPVEVAAVHRDCHHLALPVWRWRCAGWGFALPLRVRAERRRRPRVSVSRRWAFTADLSFAFSLRNSSRALTKLRASGSD